MPNDVVPEVTTRDAFDGLLDGYEARLKEIFRIFRMDPGVYAAYRIDDRRGMPWSRTADGCVQYAASEEEFHLGGDYFVDTVLSEWPSQLASEKLTSPSFVMMTVDPEIGEGMEELAIFESKMQRQAF